MTQKITQSITVLSCLLVAGSSVQGAFSDLKTAFAEATHSSELLATYYTAEPLDDSELDFAYAGVHYRYFWNFQDAEGPSPWSFFVGGHLEGIVEGPGNYFIGTNFGLRYRFQGDIFGLKPYTQVSTGVLGSDAYEDRTQNELGSFIEFRSNFTLGVAVPLGDNSQSDLHVELAIEHVSNAGLSNRNGGINLIGLSVGMNY